MSKYSLESFGYIANKEAVDLGFDVLSAIQFRKVQDEPAD